MGITGIIHGDVIEPKFESKLPPIKVKPPEIKPDPFIEDKPIIIKTSELRERQLREGRKTRGREPIIKEEEVPSTQIIPPSRTRPTRVIRTIKTQLMGKKKEEKPSIEGRPKQKKVIRRAIPIPFFAGGGLSFSRAITGRRGGIFYSPPIIKKKKKYGKKNKKSF